MNKKIFGGMVALASVLVLSSTGISAQTIDPAVMAVMESSFRSQGIIDKKDIYPDELQTLCSDKAFLESPEGQKKAIELQTVALQSVKPPSDGVYFGDWKAGEKVAQSGRGLAWNNKRDAVNGGSCYNCHRISKDEMSYGSLGPSLLGYGKIRGNSDAIVEYTWNRIYNSKSYNACNNMPRMVESGLLTEQQIKDVMALLFDPQSPVNQ
jgi:sulfur-oxidizing protein SoxX